MDVLIGKQETSPKALQHLSNAYRCIRRYLQKHRTPSDAIVAAIMSLAIHEDLKGQPGRSKIHLDAMQHIIELRGGLKQLATRPVLVQKVCRYYDHAFLVSVSVANVLHEVLISNMLFNLVLPHASIETNSHENLFAAICLGNPSLKRSSFLLRTT
jgi:hypothetical protein